MATISASLKGEKVIHLTVREILSVLKDVSELMLDLSFASLAFRDREMAKEVLKLEALVERYLDELIVRIMLAARDQEDAYDMVPLVHLAEMIGTISNSAADIAEITLLKKAVKEVPKVIMKTEGTMAIVTVKPGSYVDGKRLDESLIETRTGLRVIAIRRGQTWIFGPEGDEVLRGGDVLFVRGYEKGLDLLQKMCTEEEVEF